MLRFLALPGMWIWPAGHSEDPVSFLLVIRHRATSLRPRTDLELASAYVEHDLASQLTQTRNVAPPGGIGQAGPLSTVADLGQSGNGLRGLKTPDPRLANCRINLGKPS